MIYGSVCSGIEAATVAWHPSGWKPAFFSEIEKFPSRLLQHHYPSVPNLGDMTQFKKWNDYAIDLLVGGTPCQSFSVAGLRKGLDDPRGNLALVYLALAERYRPRWLVWENVPGVLSSSGGRDFGSFLGALAKLGYGFAYRVLDAQHFGVPQRRRRVFVVGHLGDWRPAAAVLFERHSLQGHSAPSREAGKAVAALTANGVGTCGADDNQGQAGHLIYQDSEYGVKGYSSAGSLRAGRIPEHQMVIASTGNVPHCLNAGGMGRQDYETETLVTAYRTNGGGEVMAQGDRAAALTTMTDPCNQFITFAQNQLGEVRTSDIVGTLNQNSNASGRNTPMVAFAQNVRDEVRLIGGDGQTAGSLAAQPGMKQQSFIAYQCHGSNVGEMGTLRAGNGNTAGGVPFVAQSSVRRLTPEECEALQGFSRGYTAIPKAADGPRYKALGNSMAVPCMEWIGQRIQMVEELIHN